MPATQISFAAFAATLLASAQSEAIESTPSADPALALTQGDGLVAQPVVSGGECPRFVGPWNAHRCAYDVRSDAFFGDLDVEWACGCMDAPRDHPSGSHAHLLIVDRVFADGYLVRHGC